MCHNIEGVVETSVELTRLECTTWGLNCSLRLLLLLLLLSISLNYSHLANNSSSNETLFPLRQEELVENYVHTLPTLLVPRKPRYPNTTESWSL
jgi:hypothetical protein